jgi:hypothetical protein
MKFIKVLELWPLRFSKIHANLNAAIQAVDGEADVAVFSKLYGAEMPFKFPVSKFGSKHAHKTHAN